MVFYCYVKFTWSVLLQVEFLGMDMNTRNLYDNPHQGTYITRGEWDVTTLVDYWMGVEGGMLWFLHRLIWFFSFLSSSFCLNQNVLIHCRHDFLTMSRQLPKVAFLLLLQFPRLIVSLLLLMSLWLGSLLFLAFILLYGSQTVWFPSFTFTLLGHRLVACFHLLPLFALSQPCDLKQLFLDWED